MWPVKYKTKKQKMVAWAKKWKERSAAVSNASPVRW